MTLLGGIFKTTNRDHDRASHTGRLYSWSVLAISLPITRKPEVLVFLGKAAQ